MPHDDDFDDFSHLPSVDETPSGEDKKALWKRHSSSPHQTFDHHPKHAHHEEVVEEPAVEQTHTESPSPHDYVIEEPEVARDDYVIHHPDVDPHRGSITQALRAQQPSEQTEPDALESGNWVREAFQQAEDAPQPEPATPTKRLTLDAPAAASEPQRVTLPLMAKKKEKAARSVKVDLGKLQSLASKKRTADVPRDADEPLPNADDGSPTSKLPPSAGDPAASEKPHKPALPGEKIRDENEGDPADKKGGDHESEAGEKPKVEVPHGLPHEPEPELTPKERFKKTWEKMGGRALAASVVVHIVLLTLAAVFVVSYAAVKEVDFLPGGGSKGAAEAAQSLQHKVQNKRNTWLKTKQPLKRVVSTSMATTVTLPDAPPDMDFPDASKLIGSKGMSGGGGFGTAGMGKGFGSGLGFGGKISFMGNSGVGRHIVFVVDVSASMSATGDSGTGQRISRMQLLKNELVKSISRLPPNTQYQVIYFSDFAWPHNEVDSRNLAAFDKYRWNITPDKTSVRIPQYRYVVANSTNIAHSIELIKDADNPGGTNWGSGLCMALNGYPKPDIIFFMTDGVKLDAEGWVDAVSSFNLKGGKRSIIHTTAMMEPDAALELDQLAKRNGGNFTIVTAKGFTLTGDEFFKGGSR